MKRPFFDFLHNLLAHPLLPICTIIDFLIFLFVFAWVTVPIVLLSRLGAKKPTWWNVKDNTKTDTAAAAFHNLFGQDWTFGYAEMFHDWTAKMAYGQTH